MNNFKFPPLTSEEVKYMFEDLMVESEVRKPSNVPKIMTRYDQVYVAIGNKLFTGCQNLAVREDFDACDIKEVINVDADKNIVYQDVKINEITYIGFFKKENLTKHCIDCLTIPEIKLIDEYGSLCYVTADMVRIMSKMLSCKETNLMACNEFDEIIPVYLFAKKFGLIHQIANVRCFGGVFMEISFEVGKTLLEVIDSIIKYSDRKSLLQFIENSDGKYKFSNEIEKRMKK